MVFEPVDLQTDQIHPSTITSPSTGFIEGGQLAQGPISLRHYLVLNSAVNTTLLQAIMVCSSASVTLWQTSWLIICSVQAYMLSHYMAQPISAPHYSLVDTVSNKP